MTDAAGATFPQLLDGLARRRPGRVALREKRYGIWEPLTFAEYQRRVRRFALGLAALGFQRGEVLAILGDNRPEWVIAELAAQALGGASVGLYPDGVVDEVHHVVDHARVRFIVAEDQEQVDKLIALREGGRLATVEHIVFYDPHGLEHYELDVLLEFTAVEELGDGLEQERPGWLDEQIALGSAGDTAVLCTTSGTTGKPKLAMLSHANLLSMGSSLMALDPIDPQDEFLSFLPLAWIGEQMIALACALQTGFALSFPESAATMRSDLREIGPRVMFSPPRIWESLLSSVQVRLSDAGWLKRAVFALGYALGERAADRRLRGRRTGVLLGLGYLLADWTALRPVRNQLGLVRLRRAYTGGAPLGPDVFRFFHAIGVNLKQIYGQTEICGIAVVHRDGDIRFNTVGLPIPGTELRIAEGGEILLRSPAVFSGFYRHEEATAEALQEGWLHTGDAGYLEEDGHLVVIDRARDVMEAEDGSLFSPAFIENKLKFSQYVQEAVVFGGGELPYVTSMVSIDMETIGTWAEREHISYTTYTDLAQKPEVYELIRRAVARANEDLPEGVRIRRFVLLHKQLDADDEELTRTRKVRRRTINERYGTIIDALYAGIDAVTITSLVTYQDGTQARRDISLRIESPDGAGPERPRRRRQLAGVGGRG
ncbi:MAG: AMP-binding protein [Actinobacteria bacterium]|nr:AMP-binding protein [Actinomycetota bacterium]